MYKIAKEKSQDVYIFPISHTRSKIRVENFMLGKKLFKMQNKGTIVRSRLLYYTKSMPIAVFDNIYILINLVNRARY